VTRENCRDSQAVRPNNAIFTPPVEKQKGGDVVQSMRDGEECMKVHASSPDSPGRGAAPFPAFTPAMVASPAKTCLWYLPTDLSRGLIGLVIAGEFPSLCHALSLGEKLGTKSLSTLLNRSGFGLYPPKLHQSAASGGNCLCDSKFV
jgi:hypothetical protein